VVQGERVIGFHAKRAWTAQNLSDGKVIWSGRRNAIGSGNAILVDGKLIALAEDTGDVALIDGLGNSYKELGRFMLPKESTIRKSGGRRWTHPVVSDGKLYIRDQELLYCYDLR
jgi:outer membrane protein assembly factor BamB